MYGEKSNRARKLLVNYTRASSWVMTIVAGWLSSGGITDPAKSPKAALEPPDTRPETRKAAASSTGGSHEAFTVRKFRAGLIPISELYP